MESECFLGKPKIGSMPKQILVRIVNFRDEQRILQASKQKLRENNI
jgi:hypothetical protein